ncbi:hypothetical protein D3C86_1325040 [compost metagenome]
MIIQFADSADNSTWSPWTTNVANLTRRYFRWQIIVPSPTSYSGPLANRVQVDYQY